MQTYLVITETNEPKTDETSFIHVLSNTVNIVWINQFISQ